MVPQYLGGNFAIGADIQEADPMGFAFQGQGRDMDPLTELFPTPNLAGDPLQGPGDLKSLAVNMKLCGARRGTPVSQLRMNLLVQDALQDFVEMAIQGSIGDVRHQQLLRGGGFELVVGSLAAGAQADMGGYRQGKTVGQLSQRMGLQNGCGGVVFNHGCL